MVMCPDSTDVLNVFLSCFIIYCCSLLQVEKIICNLRPALKLRLRFITHISKMEPAGVPQQPLSNGSPAQQASQVPVNVALPVTQWNEVIDWPWCEGSLQGEMSSELKRGMLYKRKEDYIRICASFSFAQWS